jgi:anti-sigma factor RsiW
MRCERYEDDIHGLIDGSLDPAARRDLEGHLRSCDACAAMADDLRRVRALAGSLERLQPPPGAWDRIARQTVTPPRGRLLWMARARRAVMPLATAACLVLAVGFVYMLKRPVPTTTGRVTQGPVAGAPAAGAPDSRALAGSVEAELRQAALHYENAIRGLETLAKDQRGVDPQIAATLQKNLQLIDQAIGESRAALAREPVSEPAQQSLFEAFRTKIAFLQDTIALVNEMRKGNQAEAARIAEGLNKS